MVIPGWHQIHFDTIDSTNEYVRRNVMSLTDRTVVFASAQTAGKGRLGRSWSSPAGGLYASLLLKPAPPPECAPAVGLLIADLICEILEQDGVGAFVKWPNDVVIGERKLAGVLAESSLREGAGEQSWLVVGFGVNMSIIPDIPDSGRGLEATALSAHRSPVPGPIEFLGQVLRMLDDSWPGREGHPLESRLDHLNDRLWKRGELIRVELSDSETIEGSILGIDQSGRLRLVSPSGVRLVQAGELRPL